MSGQDSSHGGSGPAMLRRPRFWLGLALFVGAVVAVVAIAEAPTVPDLRSRRVLAVAVLVVCNLGLMAVLLWMLANSVSRSQRVGLRLMGLLVCLGEWLAWIPMAGFAGRAVALKKLNGIQYLGSVWMGLTSAGLGLGVALIATAIWLGTRAEGAVGYAWWILGVTLGLMIWWGLPRLAGWLRPPSFGGRSPLSRAWWWFPVRVADALVHGVRWWLVMAVVGSPIAFETAMVVASAGLLVRMIRLTPAGLGVREWGLGGLTVVTAGVDPSAALSAALLDRAIELPVTLAAGFLAMRRLRAEELRPDEHSRSGQ